MLIGWDGAVRQPLPQRPGGPRAAARAGDPRAARRRHRKSAGASGDHPICPAHVDAFAEAWTPTTISWSATTRSPAAGGSNEQPLVELERALGRFLALVGPALGNGITVVAG